MSNYKKYKHKESGQEVEVMFYFDGVQKVIFMNATYENGIGIPTMELKEFLNNYEEIK